MNFVNALERIPGIIAQHEERTAKLKADVPILQGIVAKQWGKEDELKQLKSDLATLDRKISAELKPSDAEEASPNKRQRCPLDPLEQSQSAEEKKSMVADMSMSSNRNALPVLSPMPWIYPRISGLAVPASNSETTQPIA
jgi:putative DNA (cytosine-5-)-methyltransferase